MTPRILVVDDEQELERLIRQRFRKQIQAKELDFLFAANGLEALDRLQSDCLVDMVITDLNMPQMDGLSLIARLSAIDATLQAVVMSAYSDLPNIRQAMNRGAFDFLTKPIDFQDLERTIQKTLKRVQHSRKKRQQAQQTEQTLLWAAHHDSLTGLPNRRAFLQRVNQRMTRPTAASGEGASEMGVASGASPMAAAALEPKWEPDIPCSSPESLYAVLFIDLDRFKLINDSLGHFVGDALLRSVAERLQHCLREPDVVARLGGDEFAILLEDIQDVSQAIAVARRIQEQLRLPFQLLDNIEVYSQASIGISLGVHTYQQPEELLRDADIAMYCAKAQGKGRYKVFDPIMQIRARECLELENDLRRAIERHEFSLHYQPILSAATGQLQSFETLIRWYHPSRGLIFPSQFISLAEETRLVVPLGWWVFQSACQQLRQWQEQYQSSLHLNINFSIVQLQQINLVERIAEILEATGLSGESLKLEITESYLLENISAPIETLRRLKNLGIQLCIDDFGIGYSSLSRLHEFPIDILKIDRSFLKRVDIRTGTHLEMIQMIITLAHSLNMAVVAEGVETVEQLQALQDMGCNFVQGFLFSQALNSQLASQLLQQEGLLPFPGPFPR